MKIIRKCVIEIGTGKILEEDSFEYEGPIARCKGGGGSRTEVRYTASPEQRALYSAMYPAFTEVIGKVRAGRPLWEVPGMPEPPAPILPTEDLLSRISPEVKAGIYYPYREVERYLRETLGAHGQLGSARGGFSGMGASALGKYWGSVAPQIGLQEWGMVYPEQSRYAQQLYSGRLQRRAEQLAAVQAPYSVAPAFLGGAAQLTPSGIVSPVGTTSSALGAGLMSGGMGAGMGAMAFGSPWGALLGIPMALGGFAGAK